MEILSALKNEASKLQQKLDGLNSAIKAFGGGNSLSRPNGRRKKRRMSASARARIAKAQRARWARVRAAKKNA